MNETKITPYMLGRILEGSANNIKSIDDVDRRGANGFIFGKVKVEIVEISGNMALVDLILVDENDIECVRHEGKWVHTGCYIEFEGNADVLIVGRLNLSCG